MEWVLKRYKTLSEGLKPLVEGEYPEIHKQPERLSEKNVIKTPFKGSSFEIPESTGEKQYSISDSLNSSESLRDRSEEVDPPRCL